MKNNEDIFLEYLSGRIDKEEKNKFESDLEKSDQLVKDFEDYKKVYQLVNQTKQIELNKDYTESILPAFWAKKNQNKKNQLYLTFAYSITFIFFISIGYFLTKTFIINQPNNIQVKLNNLSTQEANVLADNLILQNQTVNENNLNENEIAAIDSIFSQDFSESVNESIPVYSSLLFDNGYSLTDVGNTLSEDDINSIYSELINKEIL
jgi:hypothetical protein